MSIDVEIRDGGLEDWPRSRGRPRELILMASVSVLVSAAHVSVSVLVSEVPALSTGSRESASVSRPASRPNLDGLGLGLGLGHTCLGLGLGGPGLDYNPDPYQLTLDRFLVLSNCMVFFNFFGNFTLLTVLRKCEANGHLTY